jgi:hypothetical protein
MAHSIYPDSQLGQGNQVGVGKESHVAVSVHSVSLVVELDVVLYVSVFFFQAYCDRLRLITRTHVDVKRVVLTKSIVLPTSWLILTYAPLT